jgi:hypothetical protein
MNNPWKLATLGLVLTLVTALSTGVTTAYMMRNVAPVPAQITAPATAAGVVPARVVVTTPTPQMVTTPTPVATPVVVHRAVATRPAVVEPVVTDCATGGDRAMRIVKPGLLGTLAGAGLGAIGGAIADGGKGAGKGALIGGIAGAAAGTGYGAYKTKQECGTIFGNTNLGF